MNAFGRATMNNPARALAQRRQIVPTMIRLGGSLAGCRVLELGCGRGVGTELLLDVMEAAEVHAVDLDPVMVDKARHRVGQRATVELADMTALAVPDAHYDAVVDFGAVHLVPEWRKAVQEVARVLRPRGRYYFEEIVGRIFRATMPLATGRRMAGGFGEHAYLSELERLGLTVEATAKPRLALLSGMVGDLIGVARRSDDGSGP
jgi:ubiquinone/menaquinone biosynthesis C-methylase UbiE